MQPINAKIATVLKRLDLGGSMNATSQDWAELEFLTAHIRNLRRRCQAARAMAKVSKCFGAIKLIEREIAATAAMRASLVNRLSEDVANQVAPAISAEALI
jgi:hypothetical protein